MNVRLFDGTPGIATAYAGGILELRLTKAIPPGSPLQMEVAVEGAASIRVEGKSVSARRLDGGEFEVKARLINLPRSHRTVLEAGFARDH
jgi:hypothetical protein